MKFIAHRGFKKKDQENTIKAFTNAINDKYFAGFELDIRESKDKKIVVIHDSFIDRVTNKSGLVKNKTSKELKKYNIPLLEDVLKLKTNKLILIEIKNFDMNLDNLVKIINKYKNKKIYIMSFSKNVIKKLRKYNLKCKLGYLNFVLNSDDDDQYDFIVLYKNILNDSIISRFKEKNIKVFVWGLNDNLNSVKSLENKNDLYLIVNNKL